MTNIRPVTQAKYELLLESKRNLTQAKWPIIIMTALAIGLISGSILVAYQLSTNIHFKSWYELTDHASYHMKRAEYYGMSTVHQSTTGDFNKILLPSASSSNYNASSEPTNAAHVSSNHHLVCYYPIHDDTVTRNNSLPPKDINPFLCTHILIAFAEIINCTLQPFKPDDIEIYNRVLELKNINPALKVILSSGQMTQTGGFKDFINNEQCIKSFSKQATEMLTKLHMDGLDLDWEFPDWPPPGNGGLGKKALSNLLISLHKHFNKRRLLLSVAVGAPEVIINVSYDVPLIAKVVDFINLMSYDYHYYIWYLPSTGHNAPLFPRHDEHGIFATLNTNWSAAYWVKLGMPKHKIQIGIPTYAHTFTLVNPDNNGVGAPTIGFGNIGHNGFAKYSEVCDFLEWEDTRMNWDQESKVPYAFNENEWISYDNQASVEEKARMILQYNYGGAMVWSLKDDDYSGRCTEGKLPLVQRIQQVLGIGNRRSDAVL